MGNSCCRDDVDWVEVGQEHKVPKKAPAPAPTKRAAAAVKDLSERAPKASSHLKSIYSYKAQHHLKNVFAKPINYVSSYTPPVFDKTANDKEFLKTAMAQNFVFQHLTEREETTLIKAFELQSIQAGSTLIRQGDSGDYFYVLKTGKVQFEVSGTVVGTAVAGDSFGELSLLYTCPRAASVVSLEDCSLWRLDQKTFRYVLQMQTIEANEEKVKAVEGVDLFAHLTKEDVQKLAQVMRPQKFEKGDQLVTKGKEGTVFYIIKQGAVKVTDITVGDSKFEDRELREGDYFGERSLLTKEPRAANVYGLVGGVCWTIDRQVFLEVVGTLSELVTKGQDSRFLGGIKCLLNTDLDSSELSALADLLVDVNYKAGTTIVKEGQDTYATFYMVRSGAVQVSSEQYPEYVGRFTKGGYVGEDQLLADKDGDDGDTLITSKYTILIQQDSTLALLKLLDCRRFIDTVRIGQDKPRHVSVTDVNVRLESLERHTILGAGTFGQVWLVSKGNEVCALKIQSKYELVENEQAKGVVREAKIMSQLNNQFIIKLLCTFQDLQNVYLLLKLVRGGELYSVLHTSKTDGVPEPSAKFYAAGILEGLSYMHRRSILYRDLKPENILLDTDGYPVIIDLGFAKKVTSKTFTLCGTPLYIAPEVILNRGHDKGADHWSFGVLIYEMIAGFTPFYEEDMDQISLFKVIIKGDFDFPLSGVMSMEAEYLIRRLLVTDPNRRLGSLANGIKDLFRASWFDDLNFEQYRQRQIRAPWKPKLHNKLDTSNFDSWDHLEDKLKQKDPILTAEDQLLFKEF